MVETPATDPCPACGYDRSTDGADLCPECGGSNADVSRPNRKTWREGKRLSNLAILANVILSMIVFVGWSGPMIVFGSAGFVLTGWLVLGIHVVATLLSVAVRIAHIGEPGVTRIRRWKINALFLPLVVDVLAIASLGIYHGLR